MRLRSIQRRMMRDRFGWRWREMWRRRRGHGTPGGKHPGRGRAQELAMSMAKQVGPKPVDDRPATVSSGTQPLLRTRVRDVLTAPFRMLQRAAKRGAC